VISTRTGPFRPRSRTSLQRVAVGRWFLRVAYSTWRTSGARSMVGPCAGSGRDARRGRTLAPLPHGGCDGHLRRCVGVCGGGLARGCGGVGGRAGVRVRGHSKGSGGGGLKRAGRRRGVIPVPGRLGWWSGTRRLHGGCWSGARIAGVRSVGRPGGARWVVRLGRAVLRARWAARYGHGAGEQDGLTARALPESCPGP